MSKDNIIRFPKINSREVKLKDLAKDIEVQMIQIKEQRSLIDEEKKLILESILNDKR